MRYLENYLERIKRKGNLTLADAISKTVSDVVPQYISNFSFREHVVSLLVGDVQSGKTSHMFGLMCAAADEGFVNLFCLQQIIYYCNNRRSREQKLIYVISVYVMKMII